MTTGRRTTWLAATLTTLALLGACGGSDEKPLVEPTSASPSVSATDADGFTAEQREVIDAVQAYNDAVIGRGTAPIEPSVKDLVTPEVLAELVPAETKNIEEAGLQYIGSMTLEPTKVTIDGDSAHVEGCLDGSRVAIVKRGETTAGAGSQLLSKSTIDFGLVKQGGRWLVADPKRVKDGSCS